MHHIEEIDDITDKAQMKLLVHKSDDGMGEIMGYHKILEILHQHEIDSDVYWQFKSIIGHHGP